ncbi:RodZ domain-containing protein [Psychrobacter lutiphocae]|uniref:RodZ domain-containing protein n=1 Tax=Psychrobacter lutiphocae TaxID=540500 RepID=UPI0003677459|nr:RodZ domain-containing protein [Psychrobacter lutiphocae]
MEIDNKESSTPNFDTSNQNVGSFGNRLKQARINKDLTLDDVAGELFILRRHLEAIEAEDFKELPQMAFARGFVINYAKFLGLDPDQIVESFNRNYPDELKRKSVDDIESPLKPMGTLQREGGRSIRINPLLVLGVIALIILAVFLIRMVTKAQDATTTNVQGDDISLADELSDREQSAGAAINTAVVSSGDALSNSGSAIGVGAEGVSNAAPATLDFWIQGNTQLSVVDASGQTLISGEQPRGGYKLSGQPPFKIQVNPVANVALNLNGTPIQLNDYAQNGAADFSIAP